MNTTIKLPAGHELICISGKGSHSIWRAVHTAGCGLRSSGDHRGYRIGQQKCKAQANEHTCPAAEVAEIPAPLDIPAAVREYIEAEWRGAALVMSAKRGEVIAALLAADPELGNAKASLRFALMVAEARDNDNLPLNVLPAAEGLALLQAISDATPEPVAKTAAEGRCDGGKWCRCRTADGALIDYADALKPLSVFRDSGKARCTADGCLEAWAA